MLLPKLISSSLLHFAHQNVRLLSTKRALHQAVAITTRQVPLATATESSDIALNETPVLLPGILASRLSSEDCASRASQLMQALRRGQDNLVDIELGRYDDTTPGAFDRVTMRLEQYLDWLENPERESGKIGGRQVYLAQWRAGDEIEAIGKMMRPPSVLEPLLDRGSVDLYQTSFFIGPTGTVSPLHYDPYMNLFHLQASSSPNKYAKHVTLIPPTVSEFVRRPNALGGLRNTSAINFMLHRKRNTSPSTQADLELQVNSSTPSKSLSAISDIALTCVLQEGDTLFVPKGWWHRAENISLSDKPGDQNIGWTAGVAWWFLPRNGDTTTTSHVS